MIIGTVTGSIWATRKAPCLQGQTFLVVDTGREDLVHNHIYHCSCFNVNQLIVGFHLDLMSCPVFLFSEDAMFCNKIDIFWKNIGG